LQLKFKCAIRKEIEFASYSKYVLIDADKLILMAVFIISGKLERNSTLQIQNFWGGTYSDAG